jgi:hypothetical protein
MIKFKSDDRLFIATLSLGILLLALGCIALKDNKMGLLNCFWLLPGFLFITLAFLKRELVIIDNGFCTDPLLVGQKF